MIKNHLGVFSFVRTQRDVEAVFPEGFGGGNSFVKGLCEESVTVCVAYLSSQLRRVPLARRQAFLQVLFKPLLHFVEGMVFA